MLPMGSIKVHKKSRSLIFFFFKEILELRINESTVQMGFIISCRPSSHLDDDFCLICFPEHTQRLFSSVIFSEVYDFPHAYSHLWGSVKSLGTQLTRVIVIKIIFKGSHFYFFQTQKQLKFPWRGPLTREKAPIYHD